MDTWTQSPRRFEIGLGKQKIGSRNLRQALPAIVSFLRSYMDGVSGSDRLSFHVTIACSTGSDLAVGVALALHCLMKPGDNGDGIPTLQTPETCPMTKAIIKSNTAAIMVRFPEANPSRATLQSVNSFLMG